MTENMLTPADIAAVTGGNRNNDGMFGGENGWWIILLFLIFGGRGFGYGRHGIRGRAKCWF